MNIEDQNHNQPGSPPDPEFQKEFQHAIEAYAEAVNASDTGGADEAAMKALMLATEEAMKHPTPSLQLAAEADACETAGDWPGAEAAYHRVLAIQESTGDFGLIAKPQLDLSNLFCLLGRLEDAWRYACAATASARRGGLSPLVAMTLRNQALCALQRNDVASALRAAEEAVGVIEPGRLTNSSRATALATRARCLVASGDLERAETDLKSAWDILSKGLPLSFAAGPVAALARWHEAQAELHVRKEAFPEAAAGLSQAIEYRRQGVERALCSGAHALVL